MTIPLLPRRAAFAVVATALAIVFLASGSPVPLYNVFRVEDHLRDSDLAITTVLYFVATASSLLVLGRLSDRIGRRPVAIAAVLVALAGCLVITVVHDVGTLMLGRALQGIACGMASSALGSFAVDLAPERPAWLAAFVTGTVPPVAVPVGALLSGVLAEHGPAPRILVFVILVAVLAVLAVLVARAPETVLRTPGALKALIPKVAVPQAARRVLPGLGFAILASWPIGGFYQAFGPAITADQLGTGSPIVIALVLGSVALLAPVGAALTGRLSPLPVLRLGAAGCALMVIAAMVSLAAGLIVPFLVASFLSGFAQGAAIAAGMRLLLPTAAPTQRAGLLAAVFLMNYACAAVPNLIAGRLADLLDVVQLGAGYAVLSATAALCCVLLARRPASG